jgi:hypothetical protein
MLVSSVLKSKNNKGNLEMIFKPSSFDTFSNSKTLHFSSANFAIKIKSFREFLRNEIELSADRVQKILGSCAKCWHELKKEIGEEKVLIINDKLKTMDAENMFDGFAPKNTRETKTFKSVEDLVKFVSNEKIIGNIFISFQTK